MYAGTKFGLSSIAFLISGAFGGNDPGTVDRLYKFGAILSRNYKDCRVEAKESGIVIKKSLPENDLSLVQQWTELMESMKREMTEIAPE